MSLLSHVQYELGCFNNVCTVVSLWSSVLPSRSAPRKSTYATVDQDCLAVHKPVRHQEQCKCPHIAVSTARRNSRDSEARDVVMRGMRDSQRIGCAWHRHLGCASLHIARPVKFRTCLPPSQTSLDIAPIIRPCRDTVDEGAYLELCR
jgi:hypothetical protein